MSYSILQIYDIKNKKWTLGKNMTTARLGHGCTYDGNDFIYVFGGWMDIFDYAPLIERYSIKENKWEIFMDTLDNIIGSDLYKSFSRQCLSTTKFPNHGSICVEYPNSKDNEFNGEISVINHQQEIAINTEYKIRNFIGMIIYNIDRIEQNYSFLLLFGSDEKENAMYSLIDEIDGSLDCYLPNEIPDDEEENTDIWWVTRAIAIFLFIVFFVTLVVCCIYKQRKKRNQFEKLKCNNDEMETENDKQIIENHNENDTANQSLNRPEVDM